MFSRIRSGRTTRPSTRRAEADQHVVQQRRRAGQRDALHRRVADVALVPQRLVLHAREGVAAQQPRQARRGAPTVIGLRLCGIALEPFWPARNGSWSSAISVCWRLRTSVAKRSIEPPVMAIAARNAACRSRWTICVLTAIRVQAQLRHDLALDSGASGE